MEKILGGREGSASVVCLPWQVLKDYMPKDVFHDVAPATSEVEFELQRLRASLHARSEDAIPKEPSEAQKRQSNVAFIQSLDRQMQQGLGVPLAAFQPDRLVGLVKAPWKRYAAMVESPGGAQVRRSILSDGEQRCLEFPKKWVDGKMKLCTWHVNLDRAALAGLPCSFSACTPGFAWW